MKSLTNHIPVHFGQDHQFPNASARVRCSEDEGETFGLPALWPADWETKIAGLFDDIAVVQATDARWTATLDDSSTLSYVSEAAGVAGGHKFLTKSGPTAHDTMQLSFNRGILVAGAPASMGDTTVYHFSCQLQVSDVSASGLGFACGWCPPGTTTHPEATEPANGIYFLCGSGQAGLKLRTVQNSGTAHDLSLFNQSNDAMFPDNGALNITAATDYRFSILFGQSSDGNTWGKCYVAPYRAGVKGWMTPLSSAQLADIAAMITAGNVYLAGYVGFRVASTTQRAGYVQYLMALGDR